MPSDYLFKKVSYLKFAWHAMKTRCWYVLFMKECGKNITIIKPALITPASISMGDNIFIRDNCRIEGVNLYQGTAYNPSINIGSYVSIEQNAHITCALSICIGKNTAIAANVTISDIEHPYTDISLPPEKQQITAKAVQIGEDCKIYNNAVILPGTVLGKHTVVAANAVVLGKTYPPFCVLAGIPAKVIKQYDFTNNVWFKPQDK